RAHAAVAGLVVPAGFRRPAGLDRHRARPARPMARVLGVATTMTAMKVAAIQMTSSHEIDANLAAAERHLAEAARQGALLAALPENFAFMGKTSGDKRAIAEPDGAGRIQDFLAESARRLQIWIVGGTVPLREGADGRVAAACLVYGSGGERAARYDKIHLFDV